MEPNIKFVYNTVGEEQAIVDRFRGSVDFFNKHRIRFTMPEQAIGAEYDAAVYETYRAAVSAAWAERGGDFIEQLRLFFNIPKPLQFTVRITQYGPLGFYDHKDRSVTINRHAHIEATKIIKHEMIHVMVESYVLTHHLNHSQKEFIVETLGNMFDSVTGIKDPENK